jgi:uncharacterized membrane protein YkvA (DUF1232 family)
MWWRIGLGIVSAALVSWALLVLSLLLARPKGHLVQEALRLLPDMLRLLRRLAADSTLSRGVRVRLVLLFAYLALPFDLIPDFIPVIGYADDAIIVALVLRSVVRRSGAEALIRHWPGTADGLAALWRAARLPGSGGRADAAETNDCATSAASCRCPRSTLACPCS